MTSFIRSLVYLSPFIIILIPSFNIEGIFLFYPFLLFMIIIVFLQSQEKVRINKSIHIETSIICLFIMYSFFSAFWSVDYEFGMNNTVIPQAFGIILLLIMVYMFTKENHLHSIIKSFSVLYLLMLAIGLVDIFSNTQYLAEASEMKAIINSFGNNFPLASLGNTNDFAQFIILFYPTTLVCLKNLKINQFNKVIINVIVFLSTVVVVVNTESRITYVTLPLLLLFMLYKNFTKKVIKRILLAFIIVLTCGYILTHFDVSEIGTDDSTDLRILIIKAGLEITKDNMILGSGSGSTVFLLNEYIFDPRYNLGLPMHNMIIKFSAEYGLIITMLFFLMILRIILKLYKVSKNTNSTYFKEIAVALMAILVFFPFSTSASSDASIQASTWLILGLSLSVIKVMKSN